MNVSSALQSIEKVAQRILEKGQNSFLSCTHGDGKNMNIGTIGEDDAVN